MSVTLKKIIQQLWVDKQRSFNDINKSSNSYIAGEILSTMYDLNVENKLAGESLIFLKTSNSIEHIVNILKRTSIHDVDHSISEEMHLILGSNKDHMKITLFNIIEQKMKLYNFSENHSIDVIVDEIISDILKLKVQGQLDEDTRLITDKPDHKDLLTDLINSVIEGIDLLDAIKELYLNISNREQEFFDEVVRVDDINEIKSLVEKSNEDTKNSIDELKAIVVNLVQDSVSRFTQIHGHLDHIGSFNSSHFTALGEKIQSKNQPGFQTKNQSSSQNRRLRMKNYEDDDV
uniref:Importin N-terminal domain-containing protein n=1 Tax=viral metagenome TaxID=1070528 RepID=A0A6C0BFF3_9ZZZZ